MRADAVEEKAVVADYQRAASEVRNGVFQQSESADVEVVGRFVEHQQVAAGFDDLGKVHTVAFTTRKFTDLFLLIRAFETETAAVGA